jgi:uncharacterized Zn-finger protein
MQQSFGTELKLLYLHIFPMPAMNLSKFLVDLVFPVKAHCHPSVDYNEQREKEKATPRRTGHSFQSNHPSRSMASAPFQHLSAGQIFPKIRHLNLSQGRPFHVINFAGEAKQQNVQGRLLELQQLLSKMRLSKWTRDCDWNRMSCVVFIWLLIGKLRCRSKYLMF